MLIVVLLLVNCLKCGLDAVVRMYECLNSILVQWWILQKLNNCQKVVAKLNEITCTYTNVCRHTYPTNLSSTFKMKWTVVLVDINNVIGSERCQIVNLLSRFQIAYLCLFSKLNLYALKTTTLNYINFTFNQLVFPNKSLLEHFVFEQLYIRTTGIWT